MPLGGSEPQLEELGEVRSLRNAYRGGEVRQATVWTMEERKFTDQEEKMFRYIAV